MLMSALIFGGCASISENTHAYLGSPQLAPTPPDTVQIFRSEPSQPKERLGEIILSVGGNPSRQKLENRLQAAAAKLGATGVYVVSDRTHFYPVTYWDYWGAETGEYWHRLIVGIAFKTNEPGQNIVQPASGADGSKENRFDDPAESRRTKL
jgi:hypothetical protein